LAKSVKFNVATLCRFAFDVKVNGTKVAAGSDDGTVSVWSYPEESKQVFRRNGRSNFPLIVWNPFNPDVFASYNNAVS
jgi:transducin (beta)-like 1